MQPEIGNRACIVLKVILKGLQTHLTQKSKKKEIKTHKFIFALERVSKVLKLRKTMVLFGNSVIC